MDTEARISFIGEDRGLRKALEATADATRKIYTTTQDTVGQLGKYQDKLGSVEKALEATTRATTGAITGIGKFSKGVSSSYKGLIDGSEQTIKVADALDSRFVSFAARQAGLGKQFQVFNSILQPTAGFMQEVADQTSTAAKAAVILDAAADPLIGSLKSAAGISESFAKQLINMGVIGGAAANQLLGLSKTLNGISRAVGLADTAGDVLLLGNSVKQFGEDNAETFVSATKALAPMAAKMLGVKDATTAASAAANIFKEHNDQIVRTLAQVVLKAGDVAAGLMFFGSVAKAVVEAQLAMANLNETFDAFQAMGIDSTYAKAGMQLGLMGEGLIFNTEAAREFATVAIGAFAKLQDSLAYVNTLSSGQAAGIENMGKAMTDLVNGPLKNQITSNEAASSLYNTMSAGITDMGDATKFMSAGLKLASGSGADASQTMELLAKVTSTYGLANRDAALTAAKLNGVVEQGIVTFPQLTGGLSRVATVAKASGVSFDEFLGSVSALTMTMSADDSMTGFASLLQSIAGQGEGAQKAIADLGIKFDTNSIKTKGLSASLQELYKATGGSTSKLKEIIPDALAFQTALTLMTSAADNTGKFTKNIAETTTDTLDTMFDNRQQSLIKQTTALMNGFGEVVIDFGQKLVPIIEPGIKFLQGALKMLQSLPDPLKALVASMVVGGIAMNNATRAGGFFVNMLFEMAKTAVIARLAKLAFTGQIFQEIAAVKHLAVVQKDYVGAFLQAIGIQQQGAQATKKVVAAQEAQAKAQEVLNKVMGAGKVKLEDGAKAYESAYAKIEDYRRQLAEAAKSGVGTAGLLPDKKDLDAAEKQVQKAFAAAQAAAEAGGDAVKSGFTTMMGNAKSEITAKSGAVGGAFAQVFSGVKEQIAGKQGDLKGIFSSLSEGMTANLPQAKDKVTEAMQGMLGALDNLSPQFQKRREELTEKVGGIMDKIGEMKDPDQRKKATDVLGQILGGVDLDSGIAKQKAALTGAIDNLWQSVSVASKEGTDKVRAETEKIQSLLTGVIPADLTAGVSEKFDRLNQLVKEGLAGVGDPEVVARSKAEIEKLSTSINESLAGAIDPETKARLAANLESIQATFADTVSVVSTKASGLAGDVKASFAHLGDSAAQALGSGVESIRVKADQFKESLMGMVPPEAVAEISAKFEKIDQSVRQGLAGIGDPELVARSKAEIEKLSESINASLGEVADPETRAKLTGNLESIKAGFSETVDQVVAKAGEFAGDMKIRLDNLGDKASEALSGLIAGDDVEKVKANLQKLSGELQSGLSGAGDGTTIGQNINTQLDQLAVKLQESASAFKTFSGQVAGELRSGLLPQVESSVADLKVSLDNLIPPDLRAQVSGELNQVAAAAVEAVGAIGKGVPASIEEMQAKLQEAIARSNVAIAGIADDETRAKALGSLNQISASIEKEMTEATGKLGEMKAQLQASTAQATASISTEVSAQLSKGSGKVKSGLDSMFSSAIAAFGLDPGLLQDLKEVASGLQDEMGDALATGTKKAAAAQNTLAQSTSGLVAGLTGAKEKVMENVQAGGLLERTNNALTKSRTLDLSSLKEHVVEMAKSVDATIARSAAEAKAMEKVTLAQGIERVRNAVTAAGTAIQERATVVAVASGKAISGLASSTRLLATQGLPAAIKGIATQTSALLTNTGAAAANALQGAKNIKNLSLWGNLQTLVSAGLGNSTKALYANIVASNLNNAATAKTGFISTAAAFAQGAFATTTGAVTGALRLASVAAGMFWAALGPITLGLAAIGAAFAVFQDFVPILGGAAGETKKFSKEMNDLADKYDGVAQGQEKVAAAIEKTDKNTRQYTGNVNKFLIPALETITKFTVVGQVAQALDVLTDKLSGGKVKLGLGDKISSMFRDMKDNMQDFINAPAWEAIERVGSVTEERIAATMKKSTDLGKGDFVSKTAKEIVAKANSESRSLTSDEMAKVLASEDRNLQSTKKANDELIGSLTERMETLKDPAMRKAIQDDIDDLTAQTGKLEENAKKQREYATKLEEVKKAIEENDFSKSEKNVQDLLGFTADPETGAKLAKPFNDLDARVKDIPEEMRQMFSNSMNLTSNSQRRQATQLIASSNEFFNNLKNASNIKSQEDLNKLRGDADAFLEKINSSLEAGTISEEFAKQLKEQIRDQEIEVPKLNLKGSVLTGSQIDAINDDILKGDKDLAAKQEVLESQKVEKLKTLQAQRGKNAKEIQLDLMKLDLEASDRRIAQAEKELVYIQETKGRESKAAKDAENALFNLKQDGLRKRAALEDEVFNQQTEKQQKQIQNAAAQTVQGYKQQQNALELMSKDLQLVQQLEQSRTSLAKTTAQYEDSKLASQLKLTTDLEARSILETESAERKAERIEQDYQAESRNLELQQQQATIAAEREIIQNQIAQAENKREIAMAQIELIKAKRSKASAEELEAINLQISSLQEVGSMVKSQEGQLLKAKDQQVEINANARQELEIRHQIAKEGGELDVQIAKQKEIIAQLESQAKQEQVRSEALTKAYDRQNKLLNARKSFNDTQASYVDGQLKIAIDAETSEKRKKELEQIAAAKKIETMLKQQEIERQIFEIQQLQNQAALEREKIQARIQKAQAEVEVAQAQASLEKLKADPQASERQIAAAEKQLAASLMKSQAADFSSQQLAMQEQQQQMLAGVERQQMQMNQELALDQAKSQAAQVLGNKQLQQQLAQQSLLKAIGTTNTSGAAANLQNAIQRAPAVGLSDPTTSPAVLAVQAETAQLEAQRQIKSDLLDLGGKLEDQQQRQTKAVEATGKAAQAQAKDARSLDFVARTGRTDIAQYVGEAKQTAPGKKPLTAGDVQGDPSKGLAYLEQLGKGRSSTFVNLNGNVREAEDLNRYVPGADGLTPAERDRQNNAGKRPPGSPPAPVGPYGGKFSGDPFALPPAVAPPVPAGPKDAASMAFLNKLGDNYAGMQRYVGEAKPAAKGPKITADQVGDDAMKGLQYLQQKGAGKSSMFVNLNGNVRAEEDLARYVPGADGLTAAERERLAVIQRGAPNKIAPKTGGNLPSGIEVTAPSTPSFANAQTAQATQQSAQSQAQDQDRIEKQLEPIVIEKVEITIDIASTGENDKDASKGVRQGVLDALNEVVDLVKKKRR